MSLLRLSCVDAVGDITPSSSPYALEAVKEFKGRDALLRVRDGKPNRDAEHRVPTKSGSYAQPNFFTAPLRKREESMSGLDYRAIGWQRQSQGHISRIGSQCD